MKSLKKRLGFFSANAIYVPEEDIFYLKNPTKIMYRDYCCISTREREGESDWVLFCKSIVGSTRGYLGNVSPGLYLDRGGVSKTYPPAEGYAYTG